MAGTAVYISDSEVRVYGPDYPDAGFRAVGDPAEAMPFLWSKLLAVPTERWLMVVYSNAGVSLSQLHLNKPGDQVTAAYIGKDKALIRVRPKLLEQIARRFIEAGVKSKAAAEALHMAREMASGEFDLNNESRRKKYSALLEKIPGLVFMASALEGGGMLPYMVAKCIEQLSPEHR
jgi:hypothetical protein